MVLENLRASKPILYSSSKKKYEGKHISSIIWRATENNMKITCFACFVSDYTDHVTFPRARSGFDQQSISCSVFAIAYHVLGTIQPYKKKETCLCLKENKSLFYFLNVVRFAFDVIKSISCACFRHTICYVIILVEKSAGIIIVQC